MLLPLLIGGALLLALSGRRGGGSSSDDSLYPDYLKSEKYPLPAKLMGVNIAVDILKSRPYFIRDKGYNVDMLPSIEGVTFAYCGTGKCNPQGPTHVSSNFALFLARLSAYLNKKYGVIEIDHLGIYPGNPASPGDVHNRGLAIDISGAKTQTESLTVKKNWRHPIFDAIYDFATKEATDKSENPHTDLGPSSKIGDHSYIITPSHPNPDLAAVHQDHMHIQIGETVRNV